MSDEIAGATAPPGWSRDRPRLFVHAALLAATFLTACAAGSWFWEGTLAPDAGWGQLLSLSRLARGIPYASLLLLILGAHEMGHYLACRRYGVRATLPFFLPGPPMLIGTLGAVIRIRGPIPTRRALFDIAAAGPIAGFVVALPILIVGVARATELPPQISYGASLSAPLISTVFERIFHDAANLQVGSIYGAAWVGMLVTSMNLFPVGQLDGGHALFAVSPRAHYLVSWATIFTLGLWVVVHTIAVRMPSAYTLWLVILLFLRARHPRLANDGEPLGAGRHAVALLLAAMFLLTFIATPIVFD